MFVRDSSSYYASLQQLNAGFAAAGKAPVTLTPAPEELEDEDLLEMASAGLVEIVVVDNHKAWFWQRVWPSLKLYPSVAVRTGGEIAWAIRKDSPEFVEPNIHAGVRLIRSIIDRYYANEPMNDVNKALFAFAAYNAGPGRVRQLRNEAASRGLDRDTWFNHVERIASERVGRETVTYVSNIYKYYVSYLLIQGQYIHRRELKRMVGSDRPEP